MTTSKSMLRGSTAGTLTHIVQLGDCPGELVEVSDPLSPLSLTAGMWREPYHQILASISSNPGAYILIGEEQDGAHAAYVGEAGNVLASRRTRSILKKMKPIWFAVVSSSWPVLSRTHASGLEAGIYRLLESMDGIGLLGTAPPVVPMSTTDALVVYTALAAARRLLARLCCKLFGKPRMACGDLHFGAHFMIFKGRHFDRSVILLCVRWPIKLEAQIVGRIAELRTARRLRWIWRDEGAQCDPEGDGAVDELAQCLDRPRQLEQSHLVVDVISAAAIAQSIRCNRVLHNQRQSIRSAAARALHIRNPKAIAFEQRCEVSLCGVRGKMAEHLRGPTSSRDENCPDRFRPQCGVVRP